MSSYPEAKYIKKSATKQASIEFLDFIADKYYNRLRSKLVEQIFKDLKELKHLEDWTLFNYIAKESIECEIVCLKLDNEDRFNDIIKLAELKLKILKSSIKEINTIVNDEYKI